MKKLIIVIIVCSLFVFTSCSSANKSKSATSTTATLSASEKQLQSQIDDLFSQLSAYKNIVSNLQSQIKTTETTTTPSTLPTASANDEVSNEIDKITANIKNLNDSVSILQKQVQTIQDSLKTAATNIGVTSTTLNGLSVIFISNNIDVGITGSSPAGVAQFAIKLTNTTASLISNLDVTGTITSLQSISGAMASGYPQITDAATLSSIAYSNGGGNTIFFEAYGGTKSLSIPAGGSITIRPKISILATVNNKLPATTFIIAVNAVTYDTTATK